MIKGGLQNLPFAEFLRLKINYISWYWFCLRYGVDLFVVDDFRFNNGDQILWRVSVERAN